jgi:hypothetical protein
MFIKPNSVENDDTQKSIINHFKKKRESEKDGRKSWFGFSAALSLLFLSRIANDFKNRIKMKRRGVGVGLRKIQFIWWNLMMLILCASHLISRSIIYKLMIPNVAASGEKKQIEEKRRKFNWFQWNFLALKESFRGKRVVFGGSLFTSRWEMDLARHEKHLSREIFLEICFKHVVLRNVIFGDVSEALCGILRAFKFPEKQIMNQQKNCLFSSDAEQTKKNSQQFHVVWLFATSWSSLRARILFNPLTMYTFLLFAYFLAIATQ